MNKFYIQDPTIGRYVTFPTIKDLVKYLNDMIPRAFRVSREQYVQNLIDLGHGYDDPDGVMLTRALSEEFNIGIIKDNTYVKTDVHTAVAFQKEEYGN
jgi:hypothetical protein